MVYTCLCVCNFNIQLHFYEIPKTAGVIVDSFCKEVMHRPYTLFLPTLYECYNNRAAGSSLIILLCCCASDFIILLYYVTYMQFLPARSR